jgi:release factor glutamine methyltransferase
VPANAGQALQAARARLAATSKNPRRDAEVLLAYVLGCGQAALLTYPERALSQPELARYESFLTRRLASEPMQYITGEQEFFGLLFEVTPDVLIPRPETEHLVEALLERIGPQADARTPNPRIPETRILDVGTGSGAIAVALAHALPQSQVTAVDLSLAALEVARRNAERHGVSGRVRFLHSDLLQALDSADFDVVVSNPPYVADAEVLERQVSDYEPHSALYAGPTGLEVYERLIPQARKVLKPEGWLLLEVGFGQSPALFKLLSDWTDVRFVDDLQGIPRVAVGRR